MLYGTAALSAEVLARDVEDLDLRNRQATVRRKGGADDDTAGAGLSAPDSVAACAAVPVSAIAAAPMARQPDARLMRIAISRSCSPDRFVTVKSGNGSGRGS